MNRRLEKAAEMVMIPLYYTPSESLIFTRIFYHGLPGLHGWETHQVLSVSSGSSVVQLLWLRLAALWTRTIRFPDSSAFKSGMNTLTDRACSAAHLNGWIVVRMESGAEIRFPVAENPRLAVGAPEQLNHIEVSPFGLHWADPDEDLSLHGLLDGNHGQFQKRVNG